MPFAKAGASLPVWVGALYHQGGNKWVGNEYILLVTGGSVPGAINVTVSLPRTMVEASEAVYIAMRTFGGNTESANGNVVFTHISCGADPAWHTHTYGDEDWVAVGEDGDRFFQLEIVSDDPVFEGHVLGGKSVSRIGQ